MNLMPGRPGLFSHTEEQKISLLSPPTYQQENNGGGNDNNDDTGVRMFLGSSASAAVVVEKEHMFDKVVTPSDVGKLNRLVIPKQHAEKYFPLDSSTNDKGLLLNFEDRDGKPWRFRYSYWNSSQSYVMTKGWSRFVKEKKLDAGDVVSFQRGLGELVKDRLFIDWRRRPNVPAPIHHHWNPLFGQPPRDVVYSPQLMQHNNHYIMNGYAYAPNNYAYSSTSSSRVVNGNPCPPGSIVYLRADPLQGGASTAQQPMVIESVPVVVQGRATAKRLRLFGVNMDCPIPVDESDECDVVPRSTVLCTSSSPTSSSSSLSDFRHYLRPYSNHAHEKGKGSVSSLDLDI